jgi:hypothetical protein
MSSAAPALRATLPERAKRGETVRLGLSFDGPAPGAVHILHVDTADPTGRLVPYYGGNVRATAGRAEKLLPLAGSDPAGAWQITVRDVLTGQKVNATLRVD